MRLLIGILILFLGGAGWYFWERFPQAGEFVEERISGKEFLSFKVRHTAESLMRVHQTDLLKDKESQFLEPQLSYYPYLLMEIKFVKDDALTKEGVLLWGLTDGEMVIDALNWEKTHGFEDCISARANRDDFKILRALVEAGGAIDRDKIYQKFKVETETIDGWVESCRKKRLIVNQGNKFRLHFENPRLEITPMTRLDEHLVTLPRKQIERSKRHYHPEDIKNFTRELFGSDYVIRRVNEVYLPVYTLTVQNGDGSLLVTRWNALSGKKLEDI